MWILELLLKSQESKPALVTKMVGCFFLMLSGLVGLYLLFQALTPWVGYLESGGIVCGIMAILGSCCLFIEKKKTRSLQEEASNKILTFVKDFDIEKTLKDNALTLSLFSLGVGLILSQIKDPTTFFGIYKKLKQKLFV